MRVGSGRETFSSIAHSTDGLARSTHRRAPRAAPCAVSYAYDATGGYDGDEQRVKKAVTGPAGTTETTYFGDLYERESPPDGVDEHRYHIHAAGRVVATITRAGDTSSTQYLHPDNLGSTETLTDATGAVSEKRSYDAFGARRNPTWGDTSPPPTPKTSRGYTGHEDEADLGLVNMKGRIYDPKLGRFLMPDPLVSRPYDGQGWNRYSYVRNNPLSYVDPSGFQAAPILPIEVHEYRDASGGLNIDGKYPPRVNIANTTAFLDSVFCGPQGCSSLPKEPEPDISQSIVAGAAHVPNDTGTLGSGSGHVSPPAAAASELSTAGIVGRVALGVAIGAVNWLREGQKTVHYNVITLGGYGVVQFWKGVYQTYKEQGDSLVGVLNAVNPLYHIGKAVGDVYLAADKDRWIAVGAAGVQAVGTIGLAAYGVAAGGGAVGRAGRGGGPLAYVYRLVDDAGDPVYYGISNNPAVRLGRHSVEPPGPFRGMQVISEAVPRPQALALETALIRQAIAEGRFVYNIVESSIVPPVPIEVPGTIQPTQTMLNPALYPR